MKDLEKIESLLGKKIKVFELKGKGACNNAYYIETEEGKKYIVKQEREDKELSEQNSLLVEARVEEELYKNNLSVPIPKVIFVGEFPAIYGYEYLEGDLMRSIWESLGESERIDICHKLGVFHAEMGKKISKDEARDLGVKINESTDLHPEIIEEYDLILSSSDIPEEFKVLARKAREIFNTTFDKTFFQFIHNDAHHENVLIKDNKISGIIDFGDAEYGEIAKEFSRYIRDFPNYFTHIVSAYEEESGNKLSYIRLVTNAFLSGLMEIVEDYRKGGVDKQKAQMAFKTYESLIDSAIWL